MEKKEKKKIIIAFVIALLVGLSIGVIIGISVGLNTVALFLTKIIETNGVELVIDINETQAVDYMVELINMTKELK